MAFLLGEYWVQSGSFIENDWILLWALGSSGVCLGTLINQAHLSEMIGYCGGLLVALVCVLVHWEALVPGFLVMVVVSIFPLS